METLDDATLARRWKQGDRAAAEVVARRYAPALGGLALSQTRDASLAEDVVQETFARAARQLHTLHDDHRLGGFLMGIARNAAREAIRKRGPAPRENGPEPFTLRTPGTDAARAELRERLRQAVEALPDDQREVFHLKYVSGLSYREIGAALDLTETAVSQKLYRVRLRLQEQLKEFQS